MSRERCDTVTVRAATEGMVAPLGATASAHTRMEGKFSKSHGCSRSFWRNGKE